MKVIFAQSANAIHFTSCGSLTQEGSSTDLRCPQPHSPALGSHQHPLLLTLGPRPHLRGYVSLSMITLLIFATTPWSQVEMTAVVIKAIAAEATGSS